ncbi:MAG: hypothetical protein SFW65_07070 [Alphaproteobacteria bacterium]|nr:hypothetical protein [Alphaproteobacteria bacterium]
MKNTNPTIQQSCAESWGLPLNDVLATLFEAKGIFSGRIPSKTTQNHSKNKTLLLFAFAADLTFRFDSFIGEQAHV